MANIFATLGRFFGQKVISAADEFADILDNLPNTPTTANRSRALTVENAPLIAHHNISPEGLKLQLSNRRSAFAINCDFSRRSAIRKLW
jgi:hypothetical protein